MSSEDSTDDADDAETEEESVDAEETESADEESVEEETEEETAAEEDEASEEAPDDAGDAEESDGGSEGSPLGTPEETQLIKDWTTFIAAAFGIAGAAMGLQFFVFDILDEAIISPDAGGGMAQLGAAFLALPMNIAVLSFSGIGIGLSVGLGVYFGWNLDVADETAFKVAGISGGVGTAVVLFLSAVLMGTAISNVAVEFGGAIMNAVGAGILGGLAGAGGVWVARNQAPSGFGEQVESESPPAHPAD